MGYVLPFGQMSFWGATVITNLLSPFPFHFDFLSISYHSRSYLYRSAGLEVEDVMSGGRPSNVKITNESPASRSLTASSGRKARVHLLVDIW